MKRILFLMTLLIAGFSANAQEIVYDNGITIYRGDTLKIVNYEDLLERELFKDEKGIRGITITSSLDREETERYRWISVLATTEFVALEMVERKLGSDHLKMRNLSTDEIYGIEISNDVYLENYVVNLSQIAREARERYDFNLASEKAARGE